MVWATPDWAGHVHHAEQLAGLHENPRRIRQRCSHRAGGVEQQVAAVDGVCALENVGKLLREVGTGDGRDAVDGHVGAGALAELDVVQHVSAIH